MPSQFNGLPEAQSAEPLPSVCVVVPGWPKVATTFVAQELVGLEETGLRLWIANVGEVNSIRHTLYDQVQAPVHRIPHKPIPLRRRLSAWLKTRRRPGYAEARKIFKVALRGGDKKRTRRQFTKGMILAAELPADVGLIYAHFINRATTVAHYAALIAGLPLAASAHARDIWVATESDKRAKLAAMQWCVTCTHDGAEHLRLLSDDPSKVHLVHHGLSFDRFPTDPPPRTARDGSDPADPLRLVSVGRAVEKKGFDVLLRALAALPASLAWRWEHIGDGEILSELHQLADQLGISDRILWRGAQDQAVVIQAYRDSDLFVLPCREASDGDRDGLPNVLMEAQSQGLACLSTRFASVPELIEDGVTGVLVPPESSTALAKALRRLIASPAERNRLGTAGYENVRACFQAENGIKKIRDLIVGSLTDHCRPSSANPADPPSAAP